jgi:hypothetical protein
MSNPLDDIEAEQGLRDVGRMGYQVFQGAKKDGASTVEALLVTCAYFFGMFKASQDTDDEEGGDN